MERRVAKVNISSAGGTAASGAKTCTITVPTTWIDALGINERHRELELAFDGTTITLSQHLSGPDFVERQLAQNHEVRILHFYGMEDLCSTIYADFTAQTVVLENQAVPIIKNCVWKEFTAQLGGFPMLP